MGLRGFTVIFGGRNMIKRLLLPVLFFFFGAQLQGQNQGGKSPFRMNIRAGAAVPHGMSNKAFKQSFTGIYDIVASTNFQVFRGFQAGGQYRHNLWKTPDNKIPGLNTYSQSHHAGIRIGYDHVVSEVTTAYIGLTAARGTMRFYGLSVDPGTDLAALQTRFGYVSVEVDAGVYFYTEGSFAIGVQAATAFTNFRFDPYKLFLNQHKAYYADDLGGSVSQLNVGFILVYSFWKTQ